MATVVDAVRDLLAKDENLTKPPKGVLETIRRGRDRLSTIATDRDVAFEFYRGSHYAYADDNNILQVLPVQTSTRGTGKPRWRARQTRNLIFDAVLFETSATTQRVPSYQVVPSTEDPEDIEAAQVGEKVLLYGHGKWHVRRAAVQAVMHAIIGGEAFAWPFFDTSIGPFIEDVDEETGEISHVGQGDVCIRIFGSNECYWEPGVRFEESPWHAVEQARPPASVEQMEGYMLEPGKLTPDADTRQVSGRKPNQGDKKLVLVTDYLERPTPANPNGRWITMANGRRIVPDRDYPGDELVLRKLSYAPDVDSDRDLGLVSQLIDAQRTHNDCNNKLIEWKNLALNPQWIAHPGAFKRQRRTDEPGKVYEVPDPDRNVKIIDPPAIPRELFDLIQQAERDIGRIAAQNDIPSQVESGRGIEALNQKDDSRRAAFIAELSDWYSRIGHDCLTLVRDHYTEPRLLHIKGSFGWESLKGFEGAHLRDQIDVRVFPDSIAPRTKEAVEQRIMNYAQLGWIGPEEAMASIEQGTSDAMTSRLMREEARVGRIIQRIKVGPDALAAMPDLPTGQMEKFPDPSGAIDPMTGQPVMVETGMPEYAPGWMPRYSDNLKVFRAIFEDWMATEEFERLPRPSQDAAATVYAGVMQLEAQKAQDQAMAQQAQAEQYGMDSAAAGPKPKPNPSFPALDQQGQAQS